MTPYSELFFLISSIGFIFLFIIAAVIGYYIFKLVRASQHLIERVEDNVETMGDAGRDLIEDIRSSNKKVGVTSVVIRTIYHLFKKHYENK